MVGMARAVGATLTGAKK